METDALTGLANRSYLQRRYQQLRKRSANICIVMVDLDHFKQINDQYGHGAGDEVLRTAANVLTNILRNGDTVCRWGGEEFVLLIPEITAQNCMALVEKARREVERGNVKHGTHTITFTASFGVTAGSTSLQLSKHLANADMALYESKRNGRNRATLFKK